MPTYRIELAKSARSSCRKCKEKIAKGALRIGSVSMKDDIEMVQWKHLGCFALTRNLVKEGVTIESFVDEMLEDTTGGDILPERRDEVIKEMTEEKTQTSKEDGKSKFAAIKRKAEAIVADPKEKSSKKAKLDPEVEIYLRIHKLKSEELKDILRWNRQMLGGKKEDVIARILDGELNGRLGQCPVCKEGKLKFNTAHDTKAVCNGFYDEALGGRSSCFYEETLEKAPRLQPWYSKAPTKAQEEEMDAQIDEAKGKAVQSEESKKAAEKMMIEAKDVDYKTGSKTDLKATVGALLDICGDLLALPEENPKRAIGAIVVRHAEGPAETVMEEIIKEYGFAKDKEAADKMKRDAIGAACKVADNADLLAALTELGSLYLKEGNFNASNSYKKAVAALKDVNFRITEDNAKGLGKGKTKLPGIGKSTADKIYEFVTTGTMEKLEEKRAGQG